MPTLHRTIRGAALAGLLVVGACSGNTGGLGNILGSVLGQGGGSQVSGIVQGVDGRYQQINLQQSNGQVVGVQYDNNTRVVFQNQNYSISSLERGDQVTVRIQQNGNSYYTDLVQVDQSVRNGSAGGVYGNSNGNGQMQSVQGVVRQVDVNNGQFLLDANNTRYTVYLGSNVTRADYARFQNLRSGETIRFYAVFLNNSRVELRQFY